jgi:DNA-binding MarR family transcriptional regulator
MDERQHLQALIDAPTQTRRLYPRGGFEGLEANTLQVLIAVKLLDRPAVGELMAELALAQGTASTALGHLRDRGLVDSASDEADGRRQRQRVTRQGDVMLRSFLKLSTRQA